MPLLAGIAVRTVEVVGAFGGSGRVMVPGVNIAVVDDDESVRESLPDLLRRLGYAAKAYASGQELIASGTVCSMGCLILDVAMPGMSGPELQHELIRRGHRIPTIFITGVADENLPPDLLEQGAVARLSKPFSVKELRDALAAALPGP